MRPLSVAVFLVAVALGQPPAFAQSGDAAVNDSRAVGASTTPGCAVDAADRVHLAWADNPGSDDAAEQFVFYARSADGGATFEAPRRISAGVDGGYRPREIRVATAAPSDVAVAWWATVEEDSKTFVVVYFARSSDGGDTFAPAVATSVRFRVDNLAKEGFANTTSLSVAAAPGGGYGLLATVQDYYHGFNVYFVRTDDGATFTAPKRITNYTVTIPRAAANALAFQPSGDVYAVWTESRGDFVDELRDVFYATSGDGGRTFSAPARVAHVRGIVGATARVGGATLLVAQSQKNERAFAITKVFRSSDAGRTYASRVRVARTASYSHLHENSVATNGAGVVAIAWTENSSRPGPPEGIYVAVSRDGGRTFGDPQLLAPGLYIDPPSAVVDSTGAVGVAFSSSQASLADREVLFLRVAP
jgi:hypothetical protein